MRVDEAITLARDIGVTWTADIAGALGKIGEVKELDPVNRAVWVKVDGGKDVSVPPLFLEFARTNLTLKVGSEVRVRHVSVDEAQRLQAGHGGWADRMEDMLGKIGEVVDIDEDGDFLVAIGDVRACFAPSMIELADGQSMSVGCQVRIRKVSKEEAASLQKSHGGWNDRLEALLGREGQVMSIDGDGDVHVAIDGQLVCWNPRLVELVSSTTLFPPGALVRIKQPPLEEAKRLQEEHGGWDDRMAEQLGRIGTFDGEDGVAVENVDDQFHWNTGTVAPFDCATDVKARHNNVSYVTFPPAQLYWRARRWSLRSRSACL
jgi:hypothetical protein